MNNSCFSRITDTLEHQGVNLDTIHGKVEESLRKLENEVFSDPGLQNGEAHNMYLD